MKTVNELPKVLVVDDAPINIQLLNDALQENHRVFFATNGKDALKIAATSLPDLILLDIMMPDMDGYEVCRKFKADPLLKDIPIIFITAMSQQEDESSGLELGAVDYITKPFNPSIVRLRVRNQLELKRQRDLLGRLSCMDGLTGLHNRRGFDEFIDREWRRAIRNRSPMSIIMIDIDHFKDYNDAYGHLAGDDCLKRVAYLLEASLERPADFIARYGGEEFICVLPDTEMPGTLVLAEKLRLAIESAAIPHQFSMVAPCVTISLGAISEIPSPASDSKELLNRADKLLYLAKRKGRNQVAGDQG
ncbi:PleD family two-component system response regulator [Geobacter pelophilus]|jgi:diguanylate cyclase (GGDEF)-like protein|uniref:diguanylate cyclase n=1 Tax=Geoanaerobacter pelophilus TaxID=60036 RepID=A0AAW4L3H7_9BACT|nr:PleD family two-component system response regulator [Geoanaerobacter pelophilus]MBT0664107.1 PleD family two-component system response regulator [Geoanaerobacter pelophilus]